MTYFHILCDTHQILVSNGALTESFYPGKLALQALKPADRDHVHAALNIPKNASVTYPPRAAFSQQERPLETPFAATPEEPKNTCAVKPAPPAPIRVGDLSIRPHRPRIRGGSR